MRWEISGQDANCIYARFLFARYGARSADVAKEVLQDMIACHDSSGIGAWTGVYEKVNELLAARGVEPGRAPRERSDGAAGAG